MRKTKPKTRDFTVSFTLTVHLEPFDTDEEIIKDFTKDIPVHLGVPLKDFKMAIKPVLGPKGRNVVVPIQPHPEGKVCSRCNGGGQDPEVAGCRCDCCGGTGIEE